MSKLAILNAQVLMDKDLTLTDIRVYGAICMYANTGDATCFPKQQTIASKLQTSTSAVSRSVHILIEKGYITVKPKIGKDGRKEQNIFTVKFDIIMQESQVISSDNSDKTQVISSDKCQVISSDNSYNNKNSLNSLTPLTSKNTKKDFSQHSSEKDRDRLSPPSDSNPAEIGQFKNPSVELQGDELDSFILSNISKAELMMQESTLGFIKHTLLSKKLKTKENILDVIEHCKDKWPESYGIKVVRENANNLPAAISQELSSLSKDDAEALQLWLEYKKEKKQGYKPKSIPILLKQLKKLATESNATMREIVERSISNNYSGLFPINKQSSNQKTYGNSSKTIFSKEQLNTLNNDPIMQRIEDNYKNGKTDPFAGADWEE